MFTFYQEVQTSRAVKGFASLVAKECTVIRDGKPIQINSEELVPGDIVGDIKYGCSCTIGHADLILFQFKD